MDEHPGPTDAAFDAAWREHQPFAIDLALRMLGDVDQAEDVVHEAFDRTVAAGFHETEDLRVWLEVIVTRLCLDALRPGPRRTHPSPVEDVSLDVSDGMPDVADGVVLDDHVKMELLGVLQTLNPAERGVFVLHELFRFPLATVAGIIGRSPGECRKLANEARRHIERETQEGRFAVEPVEHREVSDRFIAACAGGDLHTLMQVLAADVSGQIDLGDGLPTRIGSGRRRSAQTLLRRYGRAAGVTMVSQSVNGRPGALAFRGGRLLALLVFELRHGSIRDIHGVADPRKLAILSHQLGWIT